MVSELFAFVLVTTPFLLSDLKSIRAHASKAWWNPINPTKPLESHLNGQELTTPRNGKLSIRSYEMLTVCNALS